MQEFAIFWPSRSRHHTSWKSTIYGLAIMVGRSSSKIQKMRKKEKVLDHQYFYGKHLWNT